MVLLLLLLGHVCWVKSEMPSVDGEPVDSVAVLVHLAVITPIIIIRTQIWLLQNQMRDFVIRAKRNWHGKRLTA